ncbi:MAG: 23S rRNA (adenine(2503)-C(2))-methyltransferase RlmN [Planctomycetes bacterium]|nr:23S rRNA (adenine(2503)-C(2))-methyltransferase RlmN [Planctomycetota bacterium]
MIQLLGYCRKEFKGWFKDHSLPAYRADQIIKWIYQKRVYQWEMMSNLPKDLRQRLAEHFSIRQGRLLQQLHSQDDTIKFLIQWADEALSETVLIQDAKRRTVCVSSQVGCAVGCDFCASGKDGLQRSLEAGEIIEQLLWAQEELSGEERLSNVVIMGMGEPLANYENTLKAVEIMNADWGLGIGARHITLSTIGLPKQIRQLAHEPYQITLAVSLHAGDDQLRQKLIPWAKQQSIAKLFDAIDYYYQQTHREVTLEYVLLEGVNCSVVDADKLAEWAHRSRCNVNLINYNTVSETGYQAASPATKRTFVQRLKQRGVNVHIRQSRGSDIEAACGQLRRKFHS